MLDDRGARGVVATLGQRLQQAGLQVQVSQFFGDKVFRQSPRAGETVDIGTPVTILVTFGQD